MVVILLILLLVIIIHKIYIFLALFTDWNIIKIRSKEEMFQFVIENQEELNQVVEEMKERYGDEKMVILEKNDKATQTLLHVSKLFKSYSVNYISIGSIDEIKDIDILFAYTPQGYSYWGIYHSKTGEAADWGEGLEWIENDGKYVQIGSYFKYETEKIIDNWYYYQCYAH